MCRAEPLLERLLAVPARIPPRRRSLFAPSRNDGPSPSGQGLFFQVTVTAPQVVICGWQLFLSDSVIRPVARLTLQWYIWHMEAVTVFQAVYDEQWFFYRRRVPQGHSQQCFNGWQRRWWHINAQLCTAKPVSSWWHRRDQAIRLVYGPQPIEHSEEEHKREHVSVSHEVQARFCQVVQLWLGWCARVTSTPFAHFPRRVPYTPSIAHGRPQISSAAVPARFKYACDGTKASVDGRNKPCWHTGWDWLGKRVTEAEKAQGRERRSRCWSRVYFSHKESFQWSWRDASRVTAVWSWWRSILRTVGAQDAELIAVHFNYCISYSIKITHAHVCRVLTTILPSTPPNR